MVFEALITAHNTLKSANPLRSLNLLLNIMALMRLNGVHGGGGTPNTPQGGGASSGAAALARPTRAELFSEKFGGSTARLHTAQNKTPL